jgi:predicted nuclease of predicted toxin-antitoxin system
MKLLFDENLAPRLAAALNDVYPGSMHLRDCGLRGSSDNGVWRYAQENDFVIVSKDSDFFERSSLYGGPPKVVWLRIGNCTTARVDLVLRNSAARLAAFEASDQSCLILAHPRHPGEHGASKEAE